jgi:hypothetical protein
MAEGKRYGLSAMQKSYLWCRWKEGQSLHEIGRAFGKSPSSIRCVVSHHGWVCTGHPSAVARSAHLDRARANLSGLQKELQENENRVKQTSTVGRRSKQ